jgi:hypothetical protein
MPQHNGKSQLIARKEFKLNSRAYSYGMVFQTDSVSLRKIETLLNSRFLMHLHEFEGEVVLDKEEKAEVVKKKVAKKKKADKKKVDKPSLKKS